MQIDVTLLNLSGFTHIESQLDLLMELLLVGGKDEKNIRNTN